MTPRRSSPSWLWRVSLAAATIEAAVTNNLVFAVLIVALVIAYYAERLDA